MTTKKSTLTQRKGKNGGAENFSQVLSNIEDMVDEVSQRLWELTR